MKYLKRALYSAMLFLLWCVGKKKTYTWNKFFKLWESTGQIKRCSKEIAKNTLDEYLALVNSKP